MNESSLMDWLEPAAPEVVGLLDAAEDPDDSLGDRVPWLSLWLQDPGTSPMPDGDLPDRAMEARARLEAVLMALPYFLEQAKKRGDLATMEHFASELKIWTMDHHHHFGETGLMAIHWLKKILNSRVISVGRLQVEPKAFGHELAVEGSPQPGAKVLDLHIPASGPLDPDAVDRSIARAREDFADQGPTHFTCDSWLLAPALEKVLPPESRIRHFSERFSVILETDDEDQALERVFGRREEALAHPPQESSLQRGIARGRAEGLVFGKTLGSFPF